MEELEIYKYEAEQIEDTLRLVSNVWDSKKETTCLDRQIIKSLKMIRRVLTKLEPPKE